MPLFAFSFAEWTCRACGNRVEWKDAVIVDERDIFAVVHGTCPVVGVFAEAQR